MPSEGPPPSSKEETPDAGARVEDIDAAWEAAHAEKPARDYIAEYRDQLSDEARQSLEWIASQEAEKALKHYEETKDAEDPVVRVLREHALESLQFPKDVAEWIERDKGSRHVSNEQWKKRCDWALQELGRELIEDTITNERIGLPQKKDQLKLLGRDLALGIKHTFFANQPVYLSKEFSLGRFIGELMSRGSMKALDAVNPDTPGVEVRERIGFMERARILYPEIAERLDVDLSERGWLWDKKQNKYIKVG